MSDAGSERGGGRKPGLFEGDGKVRDYSNWERKGPLSPAPSTGPPVRDGGRLREGAPPMERRQSPAWGEGRSDAGSRPPRPERVPTAAEQDTQWRARMKPDPSPVATPDVSTPSSPQQQAPKERPKLQLQKRTVSTAEGESAGNSASDSKASPFGAARPIDTATREREIEEKRQIAIRQKKEADDKAKEEKTAREAASRAARADRADRGQAQEDDKVTSPGPEPGKNRRASRQQNGAKQAPKENGEASSQSRPSFSILRRDAEGDGEDEGTGDDIDTTGDANGSILADKEIKPQEPVVEVPKGAVEGATQSSDPTAQDLEDDGWATVPRQDEEQPPCSRSCDRFLGRQSSSRLCYFRSLCEGLTLSLCALLHCSIKHRIGLEKLLLTTSLTSLSALSKHTSITIMRSAAPKLDQAGWDRSWHEAGGMAFCFETFLLTTVYDTRLLFLSALAELSEEVL